MSEIEDRRIAELSRGLAAARTRLAAVEALHRKGGMGLRREPFCLGCHRAWPCPTAVALGADDEGVRAAERERLAGLARKQWSDLFDGEPPDRKSAPEWLEARRP